MSDTSEHNDKPQAPVVEGSVPPAPPKENSHGEHPELDVKPLGWIPMIVIAIVFVALLAGIYVLGHVPESKKQAEAEQTAKDQSDARPIVSTTRPYFAKRIPALVLPGSTRAFQETMIYPRANGYLRSRKVDIGDQVKAGQLLAEIDIPDTEAQLKAARANVETAKAALTQQQEVFELAESTFKRYKDVFEKKSISLQDLEERQTAYITAKSNLEGAKGTLRAGEAEVSRLETLVGFSQIYAPFDGVISSRNYDPGALLNSSMTSGNEMFKISQTNVLRVQIDVPQSYADQLKVGADASLLVRNFGTREFKGKIARSSGAVDVSTRTVRMEADFQNPTAELLPGMYGQIKLELAEKQMPLLIPTSALVFDAKGMRVAVVSDSSKIAMTPVTLGRDYGTEVEIISGLQPEANLVANPGQRLADGVEVRLLKDRKDAKDNNALPDPTRPPVANAESPQPAPLPASPAR